MTTKSEKKRIVEQAFQEGDRPTESNFKAFIELATDAGEVDTGTLDNRRLPAVVDLNLAHPGQTTQLAADTLMGSLDLQGVYDVDHIADAAAPYRSLRLMASEMASHAEQLVSLAQADTDHRHAILGGVADTHNSLGKIKLLLDALEADLEAHKASSGGGASVQAYETDISGRSGTIPGSVHQQGTGRAVIAQFYQGDGRQMHGVDVVNSAGDIHWSTSMEVESGSFVVIRG